MVGPSFDGDADDDSLTDLYILMTDSWDSWDSWLTYVFGLRLLQAIESILKKATADSSEMAPVLCTRSSHDREAAAASKAKGKKAGKSVPGHPPIGGCALSIMSVKTEDADDAAAQFFTTNSAPAHSRHLLK